MKEIQIIQSGRHKNPPEVTELLDLAQALDSKFCGPFGLSFGWDGILGFAGRG